VNVGVCTRNDGDEFGMKGEHGSQLGHGLAVPPAHSFVCGGQDVGLDNCKFKVTRRDLLDVIRGAWCRLRRTTETLREYVVANGLADRLRHVEVNGSHLPAAN
jgi:hypothetical protein